jgi:hypothetical protein
MRRSAGSNYFDAYFIEHVANGKVADGENCK